MATICAKISKIVKDFCFIRSENVKCTLELSRNNENFIYWAQPSSVLQFTAHETITPWVYQKWRNINIQNIIERQPLPTAAFQANGDNECLFKWENLIASFQILNNCKA